ncbi:unnamed protein product [Clavelina lepadiformis]|uniref:BRO1 domain-containing protein n=2 Tax=Clavelina lepadiformis TaxID=159417 RepID=A0ABP0EXT1_CLALP
MAYEVEPGRFFNIPLKKSSDIDLVKPMETFIKNTFDKTDEDLMKHVREFSTLRRNAVTKPLDKSITSLNSLYQYYDQLTAVSKKVPFREANGAHVSFPWKDSLQKAKFLSSTPKLSIVDGEFERLCVLYNIGALMSQIGSEANLQTDDGLKIAAKYFQESAGIFTYIKDRIMSVAGTESLTADLAPEVLNAYRCIMVAQAQECFFDKASSDANMQKKKEMLAKVAMQASYLYTEAAKAFGQTESNESLNYCQTACNAKKDMFECQAQLYQARAANEGKQFGESIARYRIIEPILKSLSKSSADFLPNFNARKLLTIAVSEKEAAEKDNNFIYNDVIPKSSSLIPISKAAIAKAKPFNENEKLSAKFTDMFASLVPLTVHNALESYEARRKELVERQIERIREQNTLVNGVMSSLNLPAALEDISGSEVPASILEKSRTVVAKGGSAPIDQLLQELPEALARNQELLTESVRILNEEQASDAELREKFGEKWRRKPSAELTSPLRQEAAKYQTIIENAQKADAIIRGKYEENKEGITLLCLPEPQLKNAVPSASPVAALKDHEVVRELRQLCEQVETLKVEREVMETEIKTAQCDLTDKFIQVLAEEGVLNEENISPGELDRIYQPLISQVSESIDRQESIMANVQRASEQFAVLKQQGGGITSREDVLKKMAAGFDRYQELSAHLQEGNKFYGDLTELLLKLQGKCSDLVFARKTEKEELLKDLQQNILSSSSSAAPTEVPAYQREQAVYAQVKKPPARPPQPQQAPATPAQPTPVAASAPEPPKPAPRKSPAPAPPVSAAAPTGQPPAPGQFPSHQQPPYGGYPSAQPPQQAYSPYPPGGYGSSQGGVPYPAYPGYPQQPGAAPYPTQTPPSGYAPPPQGYSPYPPQQPGYPGYPQQYGQQPPYYYPPPQQ